eukprot:2537970-Pyramimonas_sp.AAC.1
MDGDDDDVGAAVAAAGIVDETARELFKESVTNESIAKLLAMNLKPLISDVRTLQDDVARIETNFDNMSAEVDA